MMQENGNRSRWLIAGVVAAVVTACAIVLLVPSLRERVLGKQPAEIVPAIADESSVEFFRDKQGNPGLRLHDDSVQALQIRPEAAQRASEERALPPQTGQVNYDNDRLWVIRSR